jgi:hypothetical protein
MSDNVDGGVAEAKTTISLYGNVTPRVHSKILQLYREMGRVSLCDIHPAAYEGLASGIIDGRGMLQQMFLRLHGYLRSKRIQGRNRQKHK